MRKPPPGCGEGTQEEGRSLDMAPTPKGRRTPYASILLVEDNEEQRTTLTGILSQEGYFVEGVADGQQALDRLRRAPLPRLILLDLMLPMRRFWTLLRELERHPRWSDIPVVAMTAMADGVQGERLPGIAGCLRKPLDPNQLRQLLADDCQCPRRVE
jgi:CheY-like chemotaxis protein